MLFQMQKLLKELIREKKTYSTPPNAEAQCWELAGSACTALARDLAALYSSENWQSSGDGGVACGVGACIRAAACGVRCGGGGAAGWVAKLPLPSQLSTSENSPPPSPLPPPPVEWPPSPGFAAADAIGEGGAREREGDREGEDRVRAGRIRLDLVGTARAP
jgi:hypothetical protein